MLISCLFLLGSEVTRMMNPNSYNRLGEFYVRCFARVFEIFTAVVSELQRVSHVVP